MQTITASSVHYYRPTSLSLHSILPKNYFVCHQQLQWYECLHPTRLWQRVTSFAVLLHLPVRYN